MSNETNALAVQNESQNAPVVAGFFDLQGFELLQRVARAFSSSELVPKQYQGNIANCMIAMDMAQRMRANPLLVMQNLYMVHNQPGWSAKFLIATINSCGRFSSLRYDWVGNPGEDGYGCKAWAIELKSGQRLDGILVTWKMVRAEGWSTKNGSKWMTMPDQMFIYRAASFWQRAYAPELGMGLPTAEELQDTIDVSPSGEVIGITTGRKPTVSMPKARTPETVDQTTGEINPEFTEAKVNPDVSQAAEQDKPKKPTVEYPAGSLATEGERKLILTRARNNNLDILDLIDRAGLTGMDPSLEGLTKDGFVALKDTLPKAA